MAKRYNFKLKAEQRKKYWPTEAEIDELKRQFNQKIHNKNADRVLNCFLLLNQINAFRRIHQSHLADITQLTPFKINEAIPQARRYLRKQLGMGLSNMFGVGYRLGSAKDCIDEQGKSVARMKAHGNSFIEQSIRIKKELFKNLKEEHPDYARLQIIFETCKIIISNCVMTIEDAVKQYKEVKAIADAHQMDTEQPIFSWD